MSDEESYSLEQLWEDSPGGPPADAGISPERWMSCGLNPALVAASFDAASMGDDERSSDLIWQALPEIGRRAYAFGAVGVVLRDSNLFADDEERMGVLCRLGTDEDRFLIRCGEALIDEVADKTMCDPCEYAQAYLKLGRELIETTFPQVTVGAFLDD